MQQVYGDSGAKIKLEFSYLNINCDIQTFSLFLQKKGRKVCSSLHTFCFTKQQKGEYFYTKYFFYFFILQKVIEFNKFFFKI
jgi:hypothetical protein